MLSARFDRSKRLAGRRTFEQLFRRGKSLQEGGLSLRFLPNGTAKSRFGCAVGRIAGGAVRRNRLKRWLRESFRRNQAKIPPGLDLVVCVRALPLEITYRFVEEKFLSLCTKLPSAAGWSSS